MNWHLYRKDDPSTWPLMDCPMLVYSEEWCSFYICKWNNELKKFIEPEKKILHCWKECYYVNIGYVPDGYDTYQVKKCNGALSRCPYEDDGYCTDEECKCKYQTMENEYGISGLQRIWKEFKK